MSSGRGVVGVAWALVCGCGPRLVEAPHRAPVVPVVEVPAPREAPEGEGAARSLAARAVYHDDFARATLYTWTTEAQAEALRASRRQLVAEAPTGGGPSDFNVALAALAARGGAAGELARRLLEDPALRRRRYAWTSPMATTLGLGPRRYGDVLVAIELDPRAWVARFTPGAPEPLVLQALDGRPVTLAEAAAAPERLAAVYHVRTGPRELIPYREFVVCNEAMVARWSLGTPALALLIDEEVALLEALARGAFAHLPAAAASAAASAGWASAAEKPSLVDRWHASLAFDSPRYRPRPKNLAAIVAALRGYVRATPPLEHRPSR